MLASESFITVNQINQNEFIVTVFKPQDLKNEYIPFINYIKKLNKNSLGDLRLMNLYTWITQECRYKIKFIDSAPIEESPEYITIKSHSVFKLNMDYIQKLSETSYIVSGTELHKILRNRTAIYVDTVEYTTPLLEHDKHILSAKLIYSKNNTRLVQVQVIDIPVSIHYDLN